MITGLSTPAGVYTGPRLKAFTISTASARISGVRSFRSSNVMPCSSKGAGLVGMGWVGEVFSPGAFD